MFIDVMNKIPIENEEEEEFVSLPPKIWILTIIGAWKDEKE